METVIYERMKNTRRDSFENWLQDFLIFAKTDKISPNDIISATSAWKEAMKSEEGYLNWKRIGHIILKYSAKCYIFYQHKDAATPKELTYMSTAALDAEQVVSFFNMNYYNLEDPKIVLYGFIEALNDAVVNLNIPGVDTSEVMMRFFRIYFTNFKSDYEKGPVKTRFVELVRRLTGDMVTSNPDGTLNISKSLYTKLSDDQSKRIHRIFNTGLKPVLEDYIQAMDILKEYEDKKEDLSVIWTSKDSMYNLTRSKNRKNTYLVNTSTGVVLKTFEETPVSEMIQISENLLR